MIPKSDLLKQYVRQFPGPMDPTVLFDSFADMEHYIETNPTAYPGQIVSYFTGFEYEGVIIQPNKSWKYLAFSGSNNEIKFDVAAGATEEISVFDAARHKTVVIEYTASAGNLSKMGTLRVLEKIFFEINVTGDDMNVTLSYDNGKIKVANASEIKVEIHFIYISFNK